VVALCLFVAELLQVPLAGLLRPPRRRPTRTPADAARTGTAA
jgi:hypothetical protein